MKRNLLSLVVILLALAATASAQVPSDKMGPMLTRALDDPAAVMQRDDGTWTIWVYMEDRGLTEEALIDALAAAEQALPERTLHRRAKVTAPGAPLVDERDLPVAVTYRQAIEATGARLRQESRWLNAVSVAADRATIDSITALPFVRRVELVVRFVRPAPPVDAADRAASAEIIADARARAAAMARERDIVDYGGSLAGLEQINVPLVHEMGITGAGVVIGMLDTGFKTTHEALADIPVLARHDFINDDDVVENEPGDPGSQHNHGTKTLSTVMGFKDGELVGPAYGASAILAKTEDVSQEVPIEEDYWVAGLEWIESLGADVVSSSLGYYDWYEFSDLDGNTAVTTIAADMAVGRGLVVVNSAGNERGSAFGHIIAPADGDSVITAGAVALDGDIASFSSPGPTYDGRIKPDISAQGVNNHVVSSSSDDGYSMASGTSFSCPLSAGVAALVLSRVPELTPMQVREAMRMTADRADAPDNDFGWGILDAYAAVTYWGATIVHTPLTDTEDTVNPLVVAAVITDRLPLDDRQMDVVWRADGGIWSRAPLVQTLSDQWQATLPAQPAGTDIAYYLEVTDSAMITIRMPIAGEAAPFTFHVGPDVTPPVLVHQPLGDQPLVIWPPTVACNATDNLGIDRVELTFHLNGGPVSGPFLLTDLGDGDYTIDFPLTAAEIVIGDEISYQLTAVDQSGGALETTTGWIDFQIVDTLGVLLVIDDGDAGMRDVKIDEFKREVPSRDDGRSAATELASWLQQAGYVADVIDAAAVTPASFDGYQAVVYSAGNSTTPLTSQTMRDAVRGYVNDGGRILVEGGEVGYDALQSPVYPDFAAEVLHAINWQTDNAGNLEVVTEQQTHPLMVQPHAIPAVVAIDYAGYGDEDAVTPAVDATVVMGTAGNPTRAGVLVYDDNTAPQSGQVVYMAFAITAVDPTIGAHMIENAVAYLVADEPPATASIAGTVTLAGTSDAGGVTVTIDGGDTVVTGASGQYVFDTLYGGIHTVTAAKPGYTNGVQQVALADDEAMTGVDFTLLPVIQVDYAIEPGLSIPDNDPSGVVSLITVTDQGPLSAITVDADISHTWIGDLTVTLISPSGTQIVLHNRSGGSDDDIVGTWPTTLGVDGPGSLDDLLGQDVNGTWALFLSDAASGDTGTLNAWGLHLWIPSTVTAAGDTPMVTRLVGNTPNPFNPQTTIAFDLARRGPVKLELFDVQGRLVRCLVDESLVAGRHEARWDGRDGLGRATASGVYLCRLSADGVMQRRKMTLVR